MATRRMVMILSHLTAAASTPSYITCRNGIKLFTKVFGFPSATRKVLGLHGYLDNTGTFDLLGSTMAEADVQFVAIDFPGHGKSAHMGKDAWYGMLDYPEYVLEAASALGWNKFTLVGHSMGAAVASLVASSFPELVERCVFIDTLGPITVSPAMAPKHLRRSIQSRGVLLEKSAKTYPSFEAAVEQRLRTVALWGDQSLSRDGAICLVAGGTAPSGEDGGVKFLNDVRLRAFSPGYMTEEAVRAFLKEITCPCLLISGDAGMLKGREAALVEERKAVMGDKLQHVTLPGSHHLHLDKESLPMVASCVSDFFSSGVPGSSPSPT